MRHAHVPNANNAEISPKFRANSYEYYSLNRSN